MLICGDFQAMRCPEDLDSMACPDKCGAAYIAAAAAAAAASAAADYLLRYKQMGTFSQYFLGTKSPHCLTVFIGGNHESSS